MSQTVTQSGTAGAYTYTGAATAMTDYLTTSISTTSNVFGIANVVRNALLVAAGYFGARKQITGKFL